MALGLLATIPAQFLLWSSRGFWWATLLAWRLGPDRRVPIPFDSHVFDGSGWVSSDRLTDRIVSPILSLFGVLVVAAILAVLHYGLFRVVYLALARNGWPAYLRDVGDRLSRLDMWKAAVRRSWWVLPSFLWIRELLSWVSYGQAYAQIPRINADWPFGLVLLGVAIYTYSEIAARAIQHATRVTLRPDERRCESCGYLLRGLASSVCPECGTETNMNNPPAFGLGRSKVVQKLFRSNAALAALVVLGFAFPVWEPLLACQIPMRYWGMLPTSLRPTWRWTVTLLSGAPVKLNTFCVLKRQAEILVLHATPAKKHRLTFRWWYWRNSTGWEQHPPSDHGLEETPELNPIPKLSAGGFVLNISPAAFQLQRWLYISCLAPIDDLSVLEPDQAPEILRKLAAPTTRPS